MSTEVRDQLVEVELPLVMRPDAGGATYVRVAGRDVRSVLEALANSHPALRRRLFDHEGGLHRFVGVYLDERDIRFTEGLDTQLHSGDRLLITSAVAGG